MTHHFILKLKFLVLFSALVFPGLFPIMLSGHSSGAWTAASQCETKAFISISSWYTTASITSTEGLYIDGNKDGKIVQPEGINNDVYTIATGKFTGSTAVANSSAYFPKNTWISSKATNLPSDVLTSQYAPANLDGLKKWLKDGQGIDTTGFSITPIWSPAGGIDSSYAMSFLVIDQDVTKLESCITLTYITSTSTDLQACVFLFAMGIIH
jgi:hypothetical protein